MLHEQRKRSKRTVLFNSTIWVWWQKKCGVLVLGKMESLLLFICINYHHGCDTELVENWQSSRSRGKQDNCIHDVFLKVILIIILKSFSYNHSVFKVNRDFYSTPFYKLCRCFRLKIFFSDRKMISVTFFGVNLHLLLLLSHHSENMYVYFSVTVFYFLYLTICFVFSIGDLFMSNWIFFWSKCDACGCALLASPFKKSKEHIWGNIIVKDLKISFSVLLSVLL